MNFAKKVVVDDSTIPKRFAALHLKNTNKTGQISVVTVSSSIRTK